MKSLLLATGALVALSSFAAAADAPARQSSRNSTSLLSSSRVADWSGFYAGVHAGLAMTSDKLTQPDASSPSNIFSADLKPHPVVAGFHFGLLRQVNKFVFGLEADGEFANKQAQTTVLFQGTDTFRSLKSSNRASIRGRVGYVFDSVLFYATGGVAMANFGTRSASTGYTSRSTSGAEWGWTAGAGMEYWLSREFSLLSEYRYTDYGSMNRVSEVRGTVFPTGSSTKHKISDSAIRFGLSYHFH